MGKRATFVSTALQHVGEDGYWTWRTSGLAPGNAWCAAFVSACAIVAGVTSIIPVNYVAGDGPIAGVNANKGKLTAGPYYGQSARPVAGDIICFNYGSYSRGVFLNSYHTGIVVDVDSSCVYTVEGNSGSGWGPYGTKVRKNTYSLSDSTIEGYYHPYWNLVGDSDDGGSFMDVIYKMTDDIGKVLDPNSPEAMYMSSTPNTIYDASLREVGYLDKDGQYSNKAADYKVSTINYTSFMILLTGLSGARVSNRDSTAGLLATNGNDNVDMSALPQNAQIIGKYLLGKGLTIAQTTGVLANIYCESGYDPAALNKDSGAAGIVQWLWYKKEMVAAVGSNWAYNLSGQLDYLWSELVPGGHSDFVLTALLKVTANNLAGAKQSADVWLREFERPWTASTPESTKQQISNYRQSIAEDIWNKLVFLPDGSASTNSVITQLNSATPVATDEDKGMAEVLNAVAKMMVGNTPSQTPVGTKIEVPSTVKQVGINQYSENYSYRYSRWSRNSSAYKIAQAWGSAGKKSDRGIAILKKCYLCSVCRKFGKIGDLIQVVLDDNTSISCIIANYIGTLAVDSWGDVRDKKKGTINVIRWEQVGDEKMKVDTLRQIDLTGWSGKKIAYAVNFGSYKKVQVTE